MVGKVVTGPAHSVHKLGDLHKGICTQPLDPSQLISIILPFSKRSSLGWWIVILLVWNLRDYVG